MTPPLPRKSIAWLTAAATTLGVIACAATVLAVQEPADDLDAPDALRTHRERRVAVAKEWWTVQNIPINESLRFDRLVDASRNLVNAETAAGSTGVQRVAALKAHVDRLDLLVAKVKAERDAGNATGADVFATQAAYEEAVCDFLEARAKPAE